MVMCCNFVVPWLCCFAKRCYALLHGVLYFRLAAYSCCNPFLSQHWREFPVVQYVQLCNRSQTVNSKEQALDMPLTSQRGLGPSGIIWGHLGPVGGLKNGSPSLTLTSSVPADVPMQNAQRCNHWSTQSPPNIMMDCGWRGIKVGAGKRIRKAIESTGALFKDQ